MKLPDVNVLVNAVNVGATHHQRAVGWIEQAYANGLVALTWASLLGFLRVATMRAVLPRPLPVAEALGVMSQWLTHPSSRVLSPGSNHAELISRLLLAAGTAGNLTTDAHLAAMAIEHGATLASFDRDFARFAGLNFEHLG